MTFLVVCAFHVVIKNRQDLYLHSRTRCVHLSYFDQEQVDYFSVLRPYGCVYSSFCDREQELLIGL